MEKVTEWDLNHALHLFFRRDKQFLLIFQDPDLHIYTDRHLIPLTKNRFNNIKKLNRCDALTLRGEHICVNPQQFRPDAILLDISGRPYILETKIGRMKIRHEYEALVVQTLVYADLIITPRWKAPTLCPNSLNRSTYDLLEDVHEAHWFLKAAHEGKYRSLRERHRRHFKLPHSVSEKDFEKLPSVVLLLEDLEQEALRDSVELVKNSKFEVFKRHAEASLHKGVAFKKHLLSLKNNWAKLQQVDFSILRVDTDNYRKTVSTELTSLF